MATSTKIVFDFALWTVRDYVRFVKFNVQDQMLDAMKILTKAIVEWDIDLDLEQEGVYGKLSFAQTGAIVTLATAEFQAMFSEDAAKEGIEIDVTKWDLLQYEEYKTAFKEGDMERIAPLMKPVVRSHPYDCQLHELNFEQFGHVNATIQRQIRREYKSGK